MKNVGAWVRGNLKDTRELIGSSLEGANQAWRNVRPDEEVGPAIARAALNSWKAAAIGACIGVVGGAISDDRRPVRGAILTGLLGATIGLSAGMAWNARDVLGAVAGNAVKNIGTVRDSQWLARHPIDYA